MEAPERVFNSDLLANAGDVELAREIFPNVSLLLDWPRLRQMFRSHEDVANRAKKASRQRGLQALAAALSALWLAALEQPIHELLPGKTTLWVLAGLVALLGAIGILLGSNILVGNRKDVWLRHRLATERLRQLHFQFLVRRARDLTSTNPESVSSALRERESLLDALSHELKPGVTNQVDRIIADLGSAECWLVKEPLDFGRQEISSPDLPKLFDSYVELRFQHQRDYATKKLADGSGFWPWEPKGQSNRIEEGSYILIVITIFSHLLAVVVATLNLSGSSWLGPTMQTIGVLAAMGVLALRVLEDGLRPRAEVARLANYRGEVAELLRKFSAATKTGDRLALMERVEEASYRELREFLSLHKEASFVM